MNESTTSFFDWVTSQSIQVGFDIATSLSIIFAALTVMTSSLLRSRAERKRGINERVISTAHSRVLDITTEFEDSFSLLVDSSQKVEKPIDARVDYESDDDNGNGNERYTKLSELLLDDASFLSTIIENITAYRNRMGEYYETIQKRRYTLIPLLDSIPNEEDFVTTLEKDIDEIGEQYNQLGSNDIYLIKELAETQEYAQSIIDSQSNLSDEEKLELLFTDEKMTKLVYSIFLDSDYLTWTKSFFKEEHHSSFENFLVNRDTTDIIAENLKLAHLNFLLGLIRHPMRYVAQVLTRVSGRIQRSRIECKDILIKLASINLKLLVKGSNVRLENIISKYESDKFFGRNRHIR